MFQQLAKSDRVSPVRDLAPSPIRDVTLSPIRDSTPSPTNKIMSPPVFETSSEVQRTLSPLSQEDTRQLPQVKQVRVQTPPLVQLRK